MLKRDFYFAIITKTINSKITAMKKIVTLLFALVLINTTTKSQKKETDSLKYYQKQLDELYRVTIDSLKSTEEYMILEEKIDEMRRRPKGYSKNYGGFVLFGDLMHADYAAFNRSIVQDGFTPLDEYTGRLGFGISTKNENLMIDFYFVSSSFRNRSTKGDEKIEAGLSNIFQFDLGYDFINSKVISMYPFAGLSLRTSTLKYSKPAQLNGGYTNISNILANNQSVDASSLRPGYQAGIGLDVAISGKKSKGAKTIFFTKFGTNRPIGRDRYKIHGIKYNPGIKQADWLVSFGFKFVALN
jgi:hypothetical protein